MKWVSQNGTHAVNDPATVLAHLLAQRGLEGTEADAFLTPRLRNLDDPLRITGMGEATGRILEALERQERLCIVGDYDVDGITSTTLLVKVLRALGATPSYIVPRRMEEGYGLSPATIERAVREHNPQLLLVLDCGTNAHEEVRYLKQRGIDTLIIDHHQAKSTTIPNCPLVNPHLHDDPAEPWHDLCTAGLVFKLAHALQKRLREAEDPCAEAFDLKTLLDLVAMGTIADMVPLRGENRILARNGLHCLAQTTNPGLRALMQTCGLAGDRPLTPMDISFRLGPRINASGRLADAELPVSMLLEADPTRCLHMAQQLDALNTERQAIEREIVEQAEQQVGTLMPPPSGLVLYDENWHPGVVGIVAGKLCRSLNRPCIVLGKETTLAKGSGRSIPGVDLVKALSHCADMLDSWGGHPMAAGVSLEPHRIADFRDAFAQAINAQLASGFPEPELKIALWLEHECVGTSLLASLDQLQPFGQSNPQPIFGLRKVYLDQSPKIFGHKHLRFKLPHTSLQVIGWKMASTPPPIGQPIELALSFSWNHWNGRRHAQAELVQWRPAQEQE